MATRTPARRSTIETQKYAGPEGWEPGNAAPEDRYVELAADGTVVPDSVTATPKAGAYARQIVAKGDTVTPDHRASLGLDDPAPAGAAGEVNPG